MFSNTRIDKVVVNLTAMSRLTLASCVGIQSQQEVEAERQPAIEIRAA